MKKQLIIFAILCMAAIPSLATAGSGDPYTGVLEMGDISDKTKGVEVSLSPSVKAVYINGTDSTSKPQSQWYAIGAGHPGGTQVYATAQNITNIWKKGIADSTELDTVLGQIPETEASDTEWSTNSWTK